MAGLAGLDLDVESLAEELSREHPDDYLFSYEWEPEPQQKDLSKLREPLHQQFANWEATAQGVIRFAKRFGYCPRRLSDWVLLQLRLRCYWKWNNKEDRWDSLMHALTDEIKPGVSLELTGDYEDPAEATVEPNLILTRAKRRLVPTIIPVSFWQYIMLRLMNEPLGRLRICANSGCFSPYFIARRKDQEYCSSDCAGLIAKRRWWQEHGKEWRRKRKKEKGKKKIRR